MTNKTEAVFLRELESRGREEQRLLATEVLPHWARGLGDWLVVNPWRVLIPIAGTMYSIVRILLGPGWVEFMLGLFGGFR